MRVKIEGRTLTARDLRDMVRKDADLTMANFWTTVALELKVDEAAAHVTIDGVDSRNERELVRGLSTFIPAVLIRFGSGSERAFVCTVPDEDEDLAYRVARGLYRGLLYVAKV